MDKIEIEKLQKRVKNSGVSLITVGYISMILGVIFIPIVFFSWSRVADTNIISVLFSLLAASLAVLIPAFILIILGKRIKNGKDKDTRLYLDALILFWFIVAIRLFIFQRYLGIIAIMLFASLISGHLAFKKLLTIDSFKDSLSKKEYQIKNSYLIILFSVMLLTFFCFQFINK